MGDDRHTGLVDVIRQLGSDARDLLVQCLQRQLDLKAVRLSCRALLGLVDEGIRKVAFTVDEETKQVWRAGTLSPLRRWPRCSDVRVRIASDTSSALAGSLLALPFAGMPLEVRQRVTHLTLDTEDATPPTSYISALALRLPALRHVSLFGSLPADDLELRLLFESLDSLPHLEELGMYCPRGLRLVHLLSGRLKKLNISACTPEDDVLASISRLQQLEHLQADLFDENPACIRHLLRSLPPSTKVVELVNCEVLSNCSVILRLDRGRMLSFEVVHGVLGLHALGLFAVHVNGSDAPPPRLERITVPRLKVSAADLVALQEPELEPLREMLQRCARVQVDRMMLENWVKPELAMEGLALFGGTVAELCLGLAYGSYHVAVRLGTSGIPQPAPARSAEAGPGETGVPLPPDSLIELALRRMGLAPDGSSASQGVRDVVGQAGSDTVRLLLLHGHLVNGLALTSKSLDAWMRNLAYQAGVSPGSDEEDSSDEDEDGAARSQAAYVTTRLRYVPFDVRAVVIIQASSEDALESLEAAALSAAALLRRSAPDGGNTLLRAEVADVQLPGTVHFDGAVVRVSPGVMPAGVMPAMIHALSQAVELVWDGEGFSATWSRQQRLQWILEQWKLVHDLSPLMPI